MAQSMVRVLTLDGHLRHGHMGCLASKIHVEADKFKGQAWFLWSNSRLSQACCRIFDGADPWGTGHQIQAEISEEPFRFTRSSSLWSSPKYGPAVWMV